MSDAVNHPPHYKAANGLEAIDVIESFGLSNSFALGNAAKYLLRAGRKGDAVEDLKKARWYLDREISTRAPAAKPDRAALYYLATPYTKYPRGMPIAFEDASRLAARLLCAGYRVYSPIAHCHPLAVYGGINPANHAIWIPFDESMMHAADALLVAQMPSWRISHGVAHEIDFFTKAGKPVLYLAPASLAFAAEPHPERDES